MTGIIDTITAGAQSIANEFGSTAQEQLAALAAKADAIKAQAQVMVLNKPKLVSLMNTRGLNSAQITTIRSHLAKGDALQARVQDVLQRIDAAIASVKSTIGLGALGGTMFVGLLAVIAAVVYALYSYNAQSQRLLDGTTPEQRVNIFRAQSGADAATSQEKDKQKYYLVGGALGVLVLVYLLRGKK